MQNQFNLRFNREEAILKLEEILVEIGYSETQIQEISQKAQSEEITNRLADQKRIVEDEIRTIKIPTIIFGGRRYNRVLEPDQLR